MHSTHESQEMTEEELLNHFRAARLKVVKVECCGDTPQKNKLPPQPKPTAQPVQPQETEAPRPIATPARAPTTSVPVKIESNLKLTKEQTRQDRSETLYIVHP